MELNVKTMALLVWALGISSFVAAEEYRINLPDYQDNSGWETALQKDGITIFTQDWPGSNFVAVKTIQDMETSIESALANFLDIERYTEWVEDLREAEIVDEMDTTNTRTVYMRMNLPWPLRDRDVLIEQQVVYDPVNQRAVIKERYAGDRIPQKEGVTRIPRLTSEYNLTALPDGGVRMIWQGHNDPGGQIPAFLINWLIEDVFYESCLRMRERFEAPEFKKTLALQRFIQP